MTMPKNMIKEIDNEDQLKYVYYHSNTISILIKFLVIIITVLLFKVDTKFSNKIYYSLVVIGATVVFNSIKINHQKSVSVNRHLGIEVQESSGIFHSYINHRFIPSEKVLDVVINEGVKGLQYIFYLAIIVNDSEKLVLVFPNTQLRLPELIQVRADIRAKLFVNDLEDKDERAREEKIKNTKTCKFLFED